MLKRPVPETEGEARWAALGLTALGIVAAVLVAFALFGPERGRRFEQAAEGPDLDFERFAFRLVDLAPGAFTGTDWMIPDRGLVFIAVAPVEVHDPTNPELDHGSSRVLPVQWVVEARELADLPRAVEGCAYRMPDCGIGTYPDSGSDAQIQGYTLLQYPDYSLYSFYLSRSEEGELLVAGGRALGYHNIVWLEELRMQIGHLR